MGVMIMCFVACMPRHFLSDIARNIGIRKAGNKRVSQAMERLVARLPSLAFFLHSERGDNARRLHDRGELI